MHIAIKINRLKIVKILSKTLIIFSKAEHFCIQCGAFSRTHAPSNVARY